MTTPTPRKAIRRFDVFAEFTRQEQLGEGLPEDEAKGYGIWLAKVVASRRFGKKKDDDDGGSAGKRASGGKKTRFRSVGDELQTGETFDHDIIERMGADFYNDVFVPAIDEARDKGETYESIRDEIRKEWKPARPRPRS